ncbi:MAG: nucleotide-binding domain containing protein, partial [Caldilinea sp.]
SKLLLPRLIELAGHVMNHRRVVGVVATGGATTRELCNRWGAGGLELIDEIAPGIALGVVAGGAHDGLVLVTKAGGFGDADALVAIVQRLHEQQGRRCA